MFYGLMLFCREFEIQILLTFDNKREYYNQHHNSAGEVPINLI